MWVYWLSIWLVVNCLWWLLQRLVKVSGLLLGNCRWVRCRVFLLQVISRLLWLVSRMVLGVLLFCFRLVLRIFSGVLVRLVWQIGQGVKVWIWCFSLMVGWFQLRCVLFLFSLCVQVVRVLFWILLCRVLVVRLVMVLIIVFGLSVVSWLCRLLLVFVVEIGVFILSSIGLVLSFVFICIMVMLFFVLLVFIVCWIGVVLCQCGSSEVWLLMQFRCGILSIVWGRIRLQVIIIIRFVCSVVSFVWVLVLCRFCGCMIGRLCFRVRFFIVLGISFCLWLVGWLGWVQMVMI